MGNEVINGAVSDAELTRRADAIRVGMEQHGLDVLVASSNSEDLGGYVRYLTDLPAGSNGTTLVFPREGEATLVVHGRIGGDVALDGDRVMRGIGRVLSSPYFPAASYTRDAPAALTLTAMAGYEHATVGLAGTTQMPLPLGEALKRELPEARFIEASAALDSVRIVKSSEEQELIRQTAALQDQAMTAALAAAAPGKRESEVANVAKRVAFDLGAESGIVLIGSGPPNGGWALRGRHAQERVIEDGDMIAILIELNGPGGMFAELGRSAAIGRAPTEAVEELALILEAQEFTIKRMAPGRPYAEVWDEYNAFLTEHDRPQEQRIHCHGQGVDLVERPLVRFDEPGMVQANTNVACHPNWLRDGMFSLICDNYLIGNGPAECLHKTPQKIFEL